MAIKPVATNDSEIPDGVLRAMDRRGANIEPYGGGDQTDKAQWFLNQIARRALNGQYPAGYWGAGDITISDHLTIDPIDGHRPLTVFGAGGAGQDGPTVLRVLNDPGPGNIIAKAGPTTPYFLRDFAVYAHGPAGPVKGNPMWECGGVEASGSAFIQGVYVNGGFASGFDITGDHVRILHSNGQGNRLCLRVPSGIGTQGDIVIVNVQGDGCTWGGLGVAQDSTFAGFSLTNCPLGNAPWGVVRYPVVGAGASPPAWLLGGKFDNCATENIGNETVSDQIGDGSSIDDIEWLRNSIDWNLGTTDREWVYLGQSKPKRAAWWNSGPITKLKIGTGLPGNSGFAVPAIHASQIIEFSASESGRYVLPKLAGGWKPLEITGTQGSHLSQSLIGSSDGTDGILIKPVLLMAGSVLAGELLTRHANGGVQKYTGTGRVVGVATQDGTAGTSTKTLHMLVSGATSDTKLKNTSGSSITGGTYVKPHASGGVQPIGTLAAGEQVVGYFPNTVADGALGGADVYGNAMAA